MTEQPASRREVLAFIALQDLPMPRETRFQGHILALRLDCVADGQAWSRFFGGETTTYVNTDGRTYLDEGVIKWRGYSVLLHASDKPAVASELDEDTSSKLREIAGGGEAPTFFDRRAAKDPSVDHDSHSTCWAGPCPECPPEIAGGDQ